MTDSRVGCTHDDRELFVDLGRTPLADAFPVVATRSQDKYPLRAEFCTRCFLVELTDDSRAPDGDLFGATYGFFSGASPALVRHFAEYAAFVKNYYAPVEHPFDEVFEIACNDGTLLKNFVDWAPDVRGIDPAVPAATVAKLDGLDVENDYFTATWAQRYATANRGVRRLVVANNVIAHVPDVRDFIAGLAELLGDDGNAFVEFQYLPDLLLGNQFDLIYHEHRRFLSLTALVPLLVEAGLAIQRSWGVSTQGGSVRLLLARGDNSDLHRVYERDESWIQSPDPYRSFAGRVERVALKLNELVAREQFRGRRVALYGAPAKATTLLHTAWLTTGMIDYAVDLTPYKIGRYMPGTNIRVVAPDEENERGRADTYLLAIPNYLGTVIRRESAFIADGGQFILPLPRPVML